MPFTPYTIDSSINSTSGEARAQYVPEGFYLFEIAELAVSTPDQDNYYRAGLRIVEGAAGIGLSLSYFAGMRPAHDDKKSSFFLLGNLLTAALPEDGVGGKLAKGIEEMTIDTYEKHKSLGEKLGGALRGKRIVGLVGSTTRNGQLSSRVNSVHIAADWEARRNLPAPTGLAGAPTGAVVGANDVELPAEMQDQINKLFTAAAAPVV